MINESIEEHLAKVQTPRYRPREPAGSDHSS